MAGGKETPRQKMIGMMYMVLTALLALNVSSAVLEKFAIIDETLVELVVDSGESNERLMQSIEGSNVKSPEVDAAKEKAMKVRALTKATLAYMDDIKKKMSSDKDGTPLKEVIQDTHHADEMMLDEKNGPSMASVYEKTLNKHVADLNDIMKPKEPFKKITKTAGEYESFKNAKKELKDQKYTVFAFHGTPTMGAIAYVSQMQTEILEYERAALSDLLAITKGKVYEVDQLVPMVKANSNSIVAGTPYEGDLFVAGAASGVDPEMFKGSEKVRIEEVEISPGIKIKMGKIKFVASAPASSYDKNGVAKMSYPVRINLPNREPIIQNIEYNVIRPVAKFESEGASTLYLGCGNEVTVSVQGMTESSGISLSVPGDEGKVIQQGPGKFVIIPSRPQINVGVSVAGTRIDVRQFKAKEVPKPSASLQVGNGVYDVKRGIPPGTSIVKFVPEITDETFKRQNVKDAGYRIVSMTLQITGKTPLTLNSGTIELNKYGLRPGDSFSVFNVQVVRSTWDPSDSDNRPVNAKLEGSYIMGR
jgi:gliding motility-associated protein GldM